MPKTIVVIGGAQGGPNAAARAREFDENARIVLLEKHRHVSWVQAGLRYHLEGRVPRLDEVDREREASFEKRYRIEVRTGAEATALDVDARRVHVRNADGSVERLGFDAVIFAGGAEPIWPTIEGLEQRAPGVTHFRNLDDLHELKRAIDNNAKRAVVIGCGPIGLDAATGLRAAGLEVHIIEANSRILPSLSLTAARAAARALERSGTQLHTSTQVTKAETIEGNRRKIYLSNGEVLEADLVVMAIGMRPRTKLLSAAGASLNPDGSVRVDPHMATTLPRVYACGTAVSVPHAVTRGHLWLPQAAISDRTSQIAGRSAAMAPNGAMESLSPVAGTAMLQAGGLYFGKTGLNDAEARSFFGGDRIQVVTIHGWTCEAWLGKDDGSREITVRMVVDRERNVVVGGEVWGPYGVPRRLDILAAAVLEKWAPSRVAALDIAYTPEIGPAMDPVNAAGIMSALTLQGEAWPLEPEQLALRVARGEDVVLLDVGQSPRTRDPKWPSATVEIPLEELRDRVGELSKDTPIITLSHTGRRGHLAVRILRQHGFRDVCHLDGGALSWSLLVDRA